MSTLVQYIIVFLILASVIGWILYKLLMKKTPDKGCCSGCGLADRCTKKDTFETKANSKSCCEECEKGYGEKKES